MTHKTYKRLKYRKKSKARIHKATTQRRRVKNHKKSHYMRYSRGGSMWGDGLNQLSGISCSLPTYLRPSSCPSDTSKSNTSLGSSFTTTTPV
jgi:hypothetical protein